MKKLLFIIWMLVCQVCGAQVRIDWQQCYGSMENDYAEGVVKTEDNYLVIGYCGQGSAGTGMVGCEDYGTGEPDAPGAWLIKIDEHGEHQVQWQHCYAIGPNHFEKAHRTNGENEYFIIGNSYNGNSFPQALNIMIIKINEYGEVLWKEDYGNEHGHLYTPNGLATSDGGAIAYAPYFTAGGDISQHYGSFDSWIVKVDSIGHIEWEITLGNEGSEFTGEITQALDGGFLLAQYANVVNGIGNIGCEDESRFVEGIFTKLSAQGELEWSECYGGTEMDHFKNILELEDGYLILGNACSEDGDLEGSGYHYGTYGGYPNGNRLDDIWLLRLDTERNILWSKCYGGTQRDAPSHVFQTEDGGFFVFGYTESTDGDVNSAKLLHLQPFPMNGGVLWIFRTDASGELLWERCLGLEQTGQTDVYDVVKHNDREYTLAGSTSWYSGESDGDVCCSNNAGLYFSWDNYWVLHITDTVNYDLLKVSEQFDSHESALKIYPNPANSSFSISLTEDASKTEIELLSLSGQVMLRSFFRGKNNCLDVAHLPKGMYILKIRNKNLCCMRKVIKE